MCDKTIYELFVFDNVSETNRIFTRSGSLSQIIEDTEKGGRYEVITFSLVEIED